MNFKLVVFKIKLLKYQRNSETLLCETGLEVIQLFIPLLGRSLKESKSAVSSQQESPTSPCSQQSVMESAKVPSRDK